MKIIAAFAENKVFAKKKLWIKLKFPYIFIDP